MGGSSQWPYLPQGTKSIKRESQAKNKKKNSEYVNEWHWVSLTSCKNLNKVLHLMPSLIAKHFIVQSFVVLHSD